MSLRSLSLLLPLVAGCTEYDLHGAKAPDPPGEDPAVPQIEVSPAQVDLGVVSVGDGGVEAVLIENLGEAELRLTDLALAVDGAWSIASTGEAALAPDAATEVLLTWEALADGEGEDVLSIASNDPAQPRVEVPLSWSLDAQPVGELVISPGLHDFGTVDVGAAASTTFLVENIGAGPVTVTDLELSATSAELALDPLVEALPWTLGPGEGEVVSVTYTPTDDLDDEGSLLATSDGGNPQADLTGAGKTFEGFSTGWYVWDPRVVVDTTTDGSYVVDHHGDEDSYYYENSGLHGMTATTDRAADFAALRDYVISNAGAPIVPTGPFDWGESSSVNRFNEATFTYFLCDFYLPADADPTTYTIESGAVDDGIRVLVNGHILGHQKLSDATGQWTLEHAVPGAVNTLLVILVDDAAVNKSIRGLGFWHDGSLVES